MYRFKENEDCILKEIADNISFSPPFHPTAKKVTDIFLALEQ